MDLTVILCAIILLLLLVIIVLLINLKNKPNNSDELRREFSTMLMQTREEIQTPVIERLRFEWGSPPDIERRPG